MCVKYNMLYVEKYTEKVVPYMIPSTLDRAGCCFISLQSQYESTAADATIVF